MEWGVVTFLIQAVIGAFIMWTSSPMFDIAKLTDHGGFGSAVAGDQREVLLQRARKALVPKTWLHALRRCMPSIWLGAGFYVLYQVGSEATLPEAIVNLLGLLAGGGILFMTSFRSSYHKTMQRYWSDHAKIGATAIGRWGEASEALALLQKAALSSDPIWRAAAVLGFKQLPNSAGLTALKTLSLDAAPQVATAAAAAMGELDQVTAGHKPMSVKPLETYMVSAGKTYIVKGKGPEAKSLDGKGMVEVNFDYLERVLYSQITLRRAFRHVYCRDCYAWAEQMHFEYWDWLCCTKCKDAPALVPDVRYVTAQVGEPHAWQLQNGELRLGLWDDEKRHARSGSISALEIVGGSDINYDWAVSAVVEKLHNENPAYGKDIRVRLINDPKLDKNTLQLLQDLDPIFRYSSL